MEKNSKSETNKPSAIVASLSNISEIMSSASNFFYVMAACKQWEKEAAEGNQSSQQLLDLVVRFEKLIKIVTER